ncbi:ubiquitin family protein [Pelolinea submarina]|uniref:Ubiquitin-like domain-containing protein n=1 Tax=Pelolinea submarina TaxID=913107 RepID=A0A347ZRU6_9CHLR|nr:hypothetical protein [Pelolinea submarina]REG11421.1 hypothetical protein DFR64_1302 [Pelolinea submarina]BBB48027.1 hypothetical protein Pelsub_P1255 [Pelolinea submarina]
MPEEKKIKVKVSDSTGAKVKDVEVPSNVNIKRLIPVMVNKLGFENNQYIAVNKRTGYQYNDNDTLEGTDTKEGDLIRLMANITSAR